MTFKSRFGPGDFVYLRTGPEATRWIVTSVKFGPSGVPLYGAAWGKETGDFYEIELSDAPVFQVAGDG